VDDSDGLAKPPGPAEGRGMGKTTSPPGLQIRIITGGGDWLGPGKADLLEGIRDTGSIAAAGRRMGMSYKRAWGLVEVLNAMFAGPLVTAARGGPEGGGASLTATGARVLDLYRRLEVKGNAALAEELRAIAALAGEVDGGRIGAAESSGGPAGTPPSDTGTAGPRRA
jgi:molybdate transport system regulatory protein